METLKTKLPDYTKFFPFIPEMWERLMRDREYNRKQRDNKKKETVDIFDQILL